MGSWKKPDPELLPVHRRFVPNAKAPLPKSERLPPTRLNLMRCVGSRANYAGPIKVGSRKAIPRQHQIVTEQLSKRRLGVPSHAFNGSAAYGAPPKVLL
jgi:hypothetical protein